MKPLLLLLAVALSGDARHEVFHHCSSCVSACASSPDPVSCKQSCLVSKASECRSNGLGPGPRTTCDCT